MKEVSVRKIFEERQNSGSRKKKVVIVLKNKNLEKRLKHERSLIEKDLVNKRNGT